MTKPARRKAILAAIYVSVDCPCGIRHIATRIPLHRFSGGEGDLYDGVSFDFVCPVTNRLHRIEVSS